MTPLKQKLTIQQGRTFRFPVRWESQTYSYAPIESITASAPCRVTTTGSHGIPDGWRAAVVSARGMVEINASNNPPLDDEYRIATAVSLNQVEFNDLNSADFTAYTSGGYLQFRLPVDLAGYTARMSVKDKLAGDVLLHLSTEDGTIVVDDANRLITLLVDDETTASLTWATGVYDLEMVSPMGEVFALLTGTVTVVPEVTTS